MGVEVERRICQWYAKSINTPVFESFRLKMSYILKEPVLREIERAFAPQHLDYVRTKLAEQKLPLDRSAPPSRVHIAVIWLSEGDIKRFDQELAGASCDWRDTLVSAGLADDDWKEILKGKGIDGDDW
jgi:hypothetical protein